MGELIRREDALSALTETDEVKGYAYVVMKRALEEIPSVVKTKDESESERNLNHE